MSEEVGFRDPAGTGRRGLGCQAGWEGQAHSWGPSGLRKRANAELNWPRWGGGLFIFLNGFKGLLESPS